MRRLRQSRHLLLLVHPLRPAQTNDISHPTCMPTRACAQVYEPCARANTHTGMLKAPGASSLSTGYGDALRLLLSCPAALQMHTMFPTVVMETRVGGEQPGSERGTSLRRSQLSDKDETTPSALVFALLCSSTMVVATRVETSGSHRRVETRLQ